MCTRLIIKSEIFEDITEVIKPQIKEGLTKQWPQESEQ